MPGRMDSVKYFGVQKACSMTPSQALAATFIMAGPTAAMCNLGNALVSGSGVKLGVIRLN